MRILVTGVTGQVGGALVSRLAARTHRGGRRRSRVCSIFPMPAAIAGRLDELAPDLIVNPAAYTAVDRAEDERELAFRINAEAPGAIARWAAARGVPLIHFSTDYVFDGSGERPWREDDRTGPLSAYGASKLAGEDAVRAAGGVHLIIRTSWVYAAKGANFLRTIARLAAERKELRIVADQFGAPTSAEVIAEAVTGIVAAGGPPLAERFAAAGGLVNVATSGVDELAWICGGNRRRAEGAWRPACGRRRRADQNRRLSDQSEAAGQFTLGPLTVETGVRDRNPGMGCRTYSGTRSAGRGTAQGLKIWTMALPASNCRAAPFGRRSYELRLVEGAVSSGAHARRMRQIDRQRRSYLPRQLPANLDMTVGSR